MGPVNQERGRLMTDYIKVKDYAAARKLSPWTVYRMVERDEIDYERFGRAIRIRVGNELSRKSSCLWVGTNAR